MHRSVFLLAAMLASTGCSTTPGDAAYRAGQFEASADLYRRGAAQGDAEAALKLGLLQSKANLSGYGQAGDWFIKACELGSPVGCHNTGVGYEYAQHGLPINYAEAGRFYLKAAEQGYMQSQYNLGSLYANKHLSGDVEGLKWSLLSQKSAHACDTQPLCKWVLEDPPGHITRMKQRMSTQDIQTAEALATSWRVAK